MDKLTDAEIAELARLEAAATPGPWQVVERPEMDDSFVGMVWHAHDAEAGWWEIDSTVLTPNDAAFISATRNALPRLLAELAAARAEVERATAAADAAWKTLEMVTRATAAKADRGDTYKRRALALLNVARQARGCYWAAMGAGEALRRERDAVTAEVERARAERDAAVAAFMETGEVKLSNDAYNRLMRSLITQTHRGDTYRARALALRFRTKSQRIGNRAALRVAFKLRQDDATAADTARADCAGQLAALRALLEQVYGTVTRLDVYLMHNRRNFQFEKAQDFIHRLYALTDAQQIDAALAAHPAEGGAVK